MSDLQSDQEPLTESSFDSGIERMGEIAQQLNMCYPEFTELEASRRAISS